MVYEDKCRQCGRSFKNSYERKLRYCSLGCEANAMGETDYTPEDAERACADRAEAIERIRRGE